MGREKWIKAIQTVEESYCDPESTPENKIRTSFIDQLNGFINGRDGKVILDLLRRNPGAIIPLTGSNGMRYRLTSMGLVGIPDQKPDPENECCRTAGPLQQATAEEVIDAMIKNKDDPRGLISKIRKNVDMIAEEMLASKL